jgi:zinc transport system substrate-binding protein
MQRKKLLIKVLATATVAVAIAAVITLINRQNEDTPTDGKLTVTASFYPLYDFARQVGGDRVAVADLTPSGVEPHDYEPSPKILADARKSDVFIYNGLIEPWADSFVGDYANIAVETSKGIAVAAEEEEHHDEHAEEESDHDDHGSLDPHFWLDPVLAQDVVADIRDALIQADQAGKAYYTQRAAAYVAKLKALDVAYREGLQQCRQDSIVASHDAFGYVARRYNFTVEPIAGINPETEPSPARMAELSDYVRQNNIKYIFFEELVSPRLADTIAQETGAKTSVLNPIEGLTDEDQAKGHDYLSIQRQNLANLRAALACN